MAANPQARVGHIQLFAAAQVGQVRWRLLSGNNREIGRGAQVFADAETCRIAVKELQSRESARCPMLHRLQWLLQLGAYFPIRDGRGLHTSTRENVYRRDNEHRYRPYNDKTERNAAATRSSTGHGASPIRRASPMPGNPGNPRTAIPRA